MKIHFRHYKFNDKSKAKQQKNELEYFDLFHFDMHLYLIYQQIQSRGIMEEYSAINGILMRKASTFEEFQTRIKHSKIQKQTYLNLFLTNVVLQKFNSPHFKSYVELLVNFKDFTGKKSANINYVGYKDKISILMHACAKGNKQTIQYLLTFQNLHLQTTDPNGKNALFYAIENNNQDSSLQILNLLLNKSPFLIDSKDQNNWTLLNQALKQRKIMVMQYLLKKNANINCQLLDTKNSLLHQLSKSYDLSKQQRNKMFILLIKFKISMQMVNKEGRNNLQIVREYKKSLQESMIFNHFLDGQQSNIQSLDSQFDKASMTTFNIQTKIQEILSQRCQIQSNVCSLLIDYSHTDFQSEYNPFQEDFQNLQIDNHLQDETIDFQLFSKEILEFSAINEEKYQKAFVIIQPFIISLQKIVSAFNLKMQFVGSFATGLWTNHSDIDINLINYQNQFINFESILQKIYRIMAVQKKQLSIIDIFIDRNKINSIKINLNEYFSNFKIDIAIFHRNNQNRKYVSFILQSIYNIPFIRPLFFVFRKILQAFKLHDYNTGGVKSYTLFLMIYNVLKQINLKNLGEAFSYISLYYGVYFQYSYELISVEQKTNKIMQAEMKMNIYDPLNLKNNMGGKNTKTSELRNMFRLIYFSINQPFFPASLEHLYSLNQFF